MVFLSVELHSNQTTMRYYIVRRRIVAENGLVVHNEGDKLSPMSIDSFNGLYGMDRVNRFYTDDFLNSKPELFEKIETKY